MAEQLGMSDDQALVVDAGNSVVVSSSVDSVLTRMGWPLGLGSSSSSSSLDRMPVEGSGNGPQLASNADIVLSSMFSELGTTTTTTSCGDSEFDTLSDGSTLTSFKDSQRITLGSLIGLPMESFRMLLLCGDDDFISDVDRISWSSNRSMITTVTMTRTSSTRRRQRRSRWCGFVRFLVGFFNSCINTRVLSEFSAIQNEDKPSELRHLQHPSSSSSVYEERSDLEDANKTNSREPDPSSTQKVFMNSVFEESDLLLIGRHMIEWRNPLFVPDLAISEEGTTDQSHSNAAPIAEIKVLSCELPLNDQESSSSIINVNHSGPVLEWGGSRTGDGESTYKSKLQYKKGPRHESLGISDNFWIPYDTVVVERLTPWSACWIMVRIMRIKHDKAEGSLCSQLL